MSEYRVTVRSYHSEGGQAPRHWVNIYRTEPDGGEVQIINGLPVGGGENLERKVNLEISTYEAKYGYSFKVTTHGD